MANYYRQNISMRTCDAYMCYMPYQKLAIAKYSFPDILKIACYKDNFQGKEN